MREPKDPLLGKLIDNYEVVSVLGEGGIGKVYLGRHTFIGKQIAIKALKPELAKNKISMARFFQEAKAVNEVRHENVVDIFNLIYRPGGEAYILMELLEGRTLAQAIEQGGALLLSQLGHIGLQVCSALAAAHFRGIFHRDLKPENIFLTQRAGQKNFVKVIDFGLAKLLEHNSNLTQSGMLVGTPAYMAPEQLRGEDCDARTDIYALGLILYEMATGAMTHPAQNMGQLYDMRLKEPAPDPRERSPWLPERLCQLILRCVERAKQQRYASVIEVAVELAEACELDHEPYLSISQYSMQVQRPQGHDLFYETERYNPVTEEDSASTLLSEETQPVSFVEELSASQEQKRETTDEDDFTQDDEILLNSETTRYSLKDTLVSAPQENFPKKKP